MCVRVNVCMCVCGCQGCVEVSSAVCVNICTRFCVCVCVLVARDEIVKCLKGENGVSISRCIMCMHSDSECKTSVCSCACYE